jgi:hypothetical protein
LNKTKFERTYKMNTMNMPGYTAEVSLRKRSECYRQKEENIAASRNGGGILPARRVQHFSVGAVQDACGRAGGVYFPPNAAGVYGCLYGDGAFIVCGGDTPGCDMDM